MNAWQPGTSYASDSASTRRTENRRRNAEGRVTLHHRAVLDLEYLLHIDHSWNPTDARYIEVEDYIQKREFYQCLSKLQGLVVQRLFELQKARVPGMSKSIFCFTKMVKTPC